PLAFFISASVSGVSIHLGTWSSTKEENVPARTLDARKEILKSALNGLYPSIDLAPAGFELPALPVTGFVLGIPTVKPPDPLDSSMPVDRLIRALWNTIWGCLVLAEPVDESMTTKLRSCVINEIRTVQAAAQAERAPSPLAEYYVQLLQVSLKHITSGLECGAWRTAVYLWGDIQSYYRLASLWRGIFSGSESLPEPVRVWDSPVAGTFAADWALPNNPPGQASTPGHYQQPFQYQTLLTSSQLAAYIHLPQLETHGFSVNRIPNFDAVPPEKKTEKVVSLGNVVLGSRWTTTVYELDLQQLNRHTFIAGITGAGKTNTIFSLLKQAIKFKVPFVVIEPAKSEYRAFLNEPNVRDDLQIFTLGDQLSSPSSMTLFEVLSWPETAVGVHLDLLRSVFSASFGMWTPLPQVLEQCLHGIYKDRGWDVATNSNFRLDTKSNVEDAFPTLSELAAKVDEVIYGLGYEDKIADDMRAALVTRINGLRAGGKGRMLDVQRSVPMAALLQRPTIIELQGMGDDDDKAFAIGLLLIRLYEYRRAANEFSGLQHLLVLEEAHRLLANVGRRTSEEEADPRGKAVDTFTNLLSEIRAYGQGVVIADQIPVKLAPDVIKNTNLKIAHRVV